VVVIALTVLVLCGYATLVGYFFGIIAALVFVFLMLSAL